MHTEIWISYQCPESKNILLLTSFQPFKSIKTILSLRAVQNGRAKRAAGHIWLLGLSLPDLLRSLFYYYIDVQDFTYSVPYWWTLKVSSPMESLTNIPIHLLIPGFARAWECPQGECLEIELLHQRVSSRPSKSADSDLLDSTTSGWKIFGEKYSRKFQKAPCEYADNYFHSIELCVCACMLSRVSRVWLFATP